MQSIFGIEIGPPVGKIDSSRFLSKMIGLNNSLSYFYVGLLTHDVILENFDETSYIIDSNGDVIFINEEDYLAAMLKYG